MADDLNETERTGDSDSNSHSSEETEFNIYGISWENGIQPYSYEPECSSSDTGSSEDEEEDGDVHRLQDLNAWCHCTKCIIAATARECKCCHEYSKFDEKKAEVTEDVHCITDHPGFSGVCLNPWVLQAAYLQYKAQYGPHVAPIHERYRYTAYRQLIRWCWGYVGKDIRIILPSCVVKKIRESFPSAEYTGLKYPTI